MRVQLTLLFMAVLAQISVRANVVNRWSFNDAAGSAPSGTTIIDSESGAIATVRGTNASFNGTSIILPGTSNGQWAEDNISAYVDLPNGLISNKTNLTVEIWATPLSSQNWSRLFDFGRTVQEGDGGGEWTGATAPGGTQMSDGLFLSLQRGGDVNLQRLEGTLDTATYTFDSANATTLGVQYHYVVTYESGEGSYPAGGQVSWYRDGVLIGTLDLPYALSEVEDVNNWLGRSQWSADRNANAAYDELRIYDNALNEAEVAASYQAGVDVGAPVTAPDAITMHAGQKARVYVLDNDTGVIYPQTVAVATPPSEGTAAVGPDGSILYSNANPLAVNDSFTYTVSGLGGESDPATVTVDFSSDMRIANAVLARPESPPATFYQLTDALPGVTFSGPISMTSPPGDAQRLFVCERMAQIQLVPDVTVTNPTKQLFLDMHEAVTNRTPGASIENGIYYEDGLMGMAFHPGFATNRYFFVTYTVQVGGSFYLRLSRFEADSGNPDVADPTSEVILIDQLDDQPNHNGGDIHFGPDGYLFLATGDEGGQQDLEQNSQKLNGDFFCGVFRIDVDRRPGNPEPNPHPSIPVDTNGVAHFSIPADNPFIHTSLGGTWDGDLNGESLTNDLGNVRTEFWAHGFRHAWRMSFDSLTGDLWVGDVGQDAYEEINLVQPGENYGWVYREGTNNTGFRTPVPPGFSSTDPVVVIPHTDIGSDPQYEGDSIVGGYVYRGNRFPEFYGHYIFCDSVTGHIWERDPDTGVVTRIGGLPGAYGVFATMGVDPSNQDILFSNYIQGRIVRITTGESSGSFPQTLSETRLFADLTDLTPNPGLLPYDINRPFWSDYAIKSRWFAIPDATNTITWALDANWTIPDGILWVKHFDLELERGNPASRKRIETRVLTKTASDYYGVSYRWNEDETEAYLVADGGDEFDVQVVDGGVTNVQHWSIPSRNACLTCHTPQAGRTLGFTTRQLNMLADMGGFIGNQLDLLDQAGYFANEPDPPNTLPRHVRNDEVSYPVEERVRSYVAVNCAYCHRADGTVSGANWDGRSELTLAQTGLLDGEPINNGGNPTNKYIVVGDTLHSIVYNRIAATNGFSRMPPLATSELDQEGIALVQDWIMNELPLREDYTAWRLAQFGTTNSVEGELTANPDGDEATNWEEFVAGTLPLDPNSYLVSQVSSDGANVSVEFSVPDYRSAYVETAAGLDGPWERWDVSGNNGIMRSAGTVVITGLADDTQRFFRLVMEER